MPHAQERIAAALNEAYAANLVGREILGTDFGVDIVLHWGAGAYIVGEETALIESLEGNRGMPRLKPPYFPAAKGLYLQPTVVNNVETLSNLPWLLTHGVDEFCSTGTESSPGTRLVALSGHVNRPGVYEIPQGTTTFRELFESEHYGRGIRDGHQLKMFIPGGASAPWFFPEQVDMAMEGRPIGAAGSMLGSGAIVVMDETTDAVRACLRVVRVFARESCARATSTSSWTSPTTSAPVRPRSPRPRPTAWTPCPSRPARPRSAPSGRPRWRRSRRRSAASATSSRRRSSAATASP